MFLRICVIIYVSLLCFSIEAIPIGKQNETTNFPFDTIIVSIFTMTNNLSKSFPSENKLFPVNSSIRYSVTPFVTMETHGEKVIIHIRSKHIIEEDFAMDQFGLNIFPN